MFSKEQWQYLWNRMRRAALLNQLPISEWLFGLIVEDGFDVENNVVVRPHQPGTNGKPRS